MHNLFESTVSFHEKNANGKILFEIKDLYEEVYRKSASSMESSHKSEEIYKSQFFPILFAKELEYTKSFFHIIKYGNSTARI